MNKEQATKRPWKMYTSEISCQIFELNGNGELVADCHTTGSWELDEANAKLIVKAVNEYDKLVSDNETLHEINKDRIWKVNIHDELVEALKQIINSGTGGSKFEIAEYYQNIAKQALKKAGQV